MILFCLLPCWSGFYLAVGFVSGVVKVLDPCTLEEEGEGSTVKYSHDCITHLAFSHDSSYLAAAVSVHSWWNRSNSNRISYDQACPLQLYSCIQYITTFKMYSLHTTHTLLSTLYLVSLSLEIISHSRTRGKLWWCFICVRTALGTRGTTSGNIALTTNPFRTCCSGSTWTVPGHACCPWAWIADWSVASGRRYKHIRDYLK